MSSLFKPFKIGSMDIKNRFMRSATTSYWSDERGIIQPEIIALYSKLAMGRVGLIVKGHLYVKDSGKAHVRMAGISHDYHVPNLKMLTNEVHKYGSKIVAQLNHGGINSLIDKAGPSPYLVDDEKTGVLSSDDIHEIIQAFGKAAERAIIAGFDGVQIHGAHGYLISQFLSRLVNRRTDGWGGNLKNRMRLLLQVYEEIRDKIGKGLPILLKINCDDFSPKGFTIEDSLKVTEVICKKGLNAIEVSGGGLGRQQNLRSRAQSHDPKLREAIFAGYAKKLREVAQPTPLALVNGIRSLECMETLITENIVDLISMSRPFIREPNLIKQFMSGQKKATCTSCDACISEKVFSKMMLRCHLT
jgi:2,4-dienoyl-CoA reductase-like NADH-dependent reductase (Old Yellow Enzyme family)